MPDNKTLMPGWKIWRFEQMATNVNVRVDNPSESGMDHYIGLEHLDTDSLKIRRWGRPADVQATKLMFRKGDIIFGKRRAYQRKLAVADFDGICSAHAMVLRARSEAVAPEFLPFFMSSDLFMERAVEISVGSLSPTVNWKTLAAQKFMLPPMELQLRLAKAFCAIQSCVELTSECSSWANTTLSSYLCETFDGIERVAPLQSLCKPIVRGIDSPGPEVEDGVPYVRIAEMTGPEGIQLKNLKRTSPEIASQHPASRLDADDLVVALRGVVGLPVRTPKEAAGANLSRGTARVSVLDGIDANFVYWALLSQRVRREVLRLATGWKGEDLREITLAELRSLQIPLVDIADQKRIAGVCEALAGAAKAAGARSMRARALMRQLFRSELEEVQLVH